MKYISTDGKEFSTEGECLAYEYEQLYNKLVIASFDPAEFSYAGLGLPHNRIDIVRIESIADIVVVNMYAKYYIGMGESIILTREDIGKTILIHIEDEHYYSRYLTRLGTIDEYADYIRKSLTTLTSGDEIGIFDFSSGGHDYTIYHPQSVDDVDEINEKIIDCYVELWGDPDKVDDLQLYMLTADDIGKYVVVDYNADEFPGRAFSLDEIIDGLYSAYNKAIQEGGYK